MTEEKNQNNFNPFRIIFREWQQGDYLISTDVNRLDFLVIHHFLTNSYWAKGIPIEVVKSSIENSLVFGIYNNNQQIGLARVITDFATFAYIADVFVIEGFRRLGLSKWLMEVIVTCPELQGVRRWLLATQDAHKLYQKFGFTELNHPERFMEKLVPNIYKKESCQNEYANG